MRYQRNTENTPVSSYANPISICIMPDIVHSNTSNSVRTVTLPTCTRDLHMSPITWRCLVGISIHSCVNESQENTAEACLNYIVLAIHFPPTHLMPPSSSSTLRFAERRHAHSEQRVFQRPQLRYETQSTMQEATCNP
jgi:hypothetical protein